MHLCSNLSILWQCLSLGLEWKLTFSSPVATAEFSKFAGTLRAALSQHHLKEFVVIHTVRGFSVVNEAEVDVFLAFSCFLDDPTDVGNFISGASAFSKPSLNIWMFSVHILLRPSLNDFEHCLASSLNECNYAVVWAFFGIVFLWDWNENWPSPVLWPLMNLPNLLTYWLQHFNSITF